MGLDPQRLYGALLDAGIGEFSGVPCSILDPLIVEAERSSRVHYLPASVEGEAVAAAAGAWLAGGLGAVLLQNSGLGNAINPLASLAIPYEIPLLSIVSWRGEPGRKDAVHHYPMGEATPGLFDLLDIPASVLREDSDLDAVVGEAVATMRAKRRPAALIVPRGLFDKVPPDPGAPAPVAPLSRRRDPAAAAIPRFEGGALPSRSEALEAWLARRPDAFVVSTTGYMSREVSANARWGRDFPMQGSMGFAAAIALGISRVQPDAPLCVLDGDGALLMRLGSLATVGASAPRNLVHIVFDNAAYASTGGQATVSPGVDFADVARACGVPRVATCSGRDGLCDAMDWLAAGFGRGPSLLHLGIDRSETAELERPKISPPEIAAAFRAELAGVLA